MNLSVTAPPIKAHYQKELNSSDPLIQDHKVNLSTLMSGAHQIESVCGQGSPFQQSQINRLSEIVFMQPIVLASENRLIGFHFSQKEGQNDCKFEVRDEWQRVCTRGKLSYCQELPEPMQLSLTEVKKMAKSVMEQQEIDRFFELRGTNYGDLYRGLRKISIYKSLALGEINIAEGSLAHCSGFRIHPNVFDSALQSVIWHAKSGQSQTSELATYIPFSIDNIFVYSSLYHGTCYFSLVNKVIYNNNSGALVFDIDVLDENGLNILKIAGFCLREISHRSTSRQG